MDSHSDCSFSSGDSSRILVTPKYLKPSEPFEFISCFGLSLNIQFFSSYSLLYHDNLDTPTIVVSSLKKQLGKISLTAFIPSEIGSFLTTLTLHLRNCFAVDIRVVPVEYSVTSISNGMKCSS